MGVTNYDSHFAGKALSLKERLNALLTPQSRALLRALIRSRSKELNQNSPLGLLSSLIYPALVAVMMYILFQERFGNQVSFYPLFILIGVSIVSFFSNATLNVMGAFSQNRDLLLNSTVSRDVVIVAQLFSSCMKLFAELMVCSVLSIFVAGVSVQIFALLIIIPAFVAVVWGIGEVLCIASCLARDTSHVWSMLCRVLLFATPVFYELDAMPPFAHRAVYWLNPITPFVIATRQSLLGAGTSNPLVYVHTALLGIGVLFLGNLAISKLGNISLERM